MELTQGVSEILELGKNLEPYHELLRGELGRNILNKLEPAENLNVLKQRENLLREWLNFIDHNGRFIINSVDPVSNMFRNAKRSGILSGEELLKVRALLNCAKKIRESLGEKLKTGSYENIDALRKNIRDFNNEIENLNVIEDSGRLNDHASEKLFNIRTELENLKRNARNISRKIFENPEILNMLQEKSLTFRDGRFLILVRQEFINRFPGLAFERSSSGNSVYMEPSSLSRINNNLIIKTRDERDEEYKILSDLTRLIISRENAIINAEKTIGTFEILNICDYLIRDKKWIIPEFSGKKFFKLVGACHPMLREKAVPLDMSCGEYFNSLVITGPNTGGKTVALKTAGILIILSWMGLPIPARDGTVIGNFDNIFADIGDEQSIEQNLSTFSSHLKKIIYILKNITSSSLVLLDELGAGTDPYEGAALGVAILEILKNRGAITLATTHHNPVKQYALTTPNVETAGMEFDIENLQPTYKLLMGVPGRSNAILIARRYGMPEEVLKIAQKNLDSREITTEDIMSELTERKAALDMAEKISRDKMREAEELQLKYKARVKEIDLQRDKIMEAADRRAERVISHAERTSQNIIRELDESIIKNAAINNMNIKREELKKIRNAIETRRVKRVEREIENAPKPFQPVPGATAQIAGSSLVGLIEEVKNGRAYLISGAMKLDVPIDKLIATEKKAKVANPPVDTTKLLNNETVPASIMVRGMYVDEAMPLVESYLDRAYRSGHSVVTVIHGRGEGILRREVHALCSRLKYVKEYRLGVEGEGGYGVTIVTFK